MSSYLSQVARPITLKKDGIQTRNRKLALKARSKGQFDGGMLSAAAPSGVQDFFKPFDSRFGGYGAAGSGSSYLPAAAGATGYYGQMHAAAAAASQYHHPSASMAAASNLGTGFGTAAAAAAGFSPMMAGAMA